jgi:hypothetical protein
MPPNFKISNLALVSPPSDLAELCEHVITSLFTIQPPASSMPARYPFRKGCDTPPDSPRPQPGRVVKPREPPPLVEFVVSIYLPFVCLASCANPALDVFEGLCTLPHAVARLHRAPVSSTPLSPQGTLPLCKGNLLVATPPLPLVFDAFIENLHGRHVLEQVVDDRWRQLLPAQGGQPDGARALCISRLERRRRSRGTRPVRRTDRGRLPARTSSSSGSSSCHL